MLSELFPFFFVGSLVFSLASAFWGPRRIAMSWVAWFCLIFAVGVAAAVVSEGSGRSWGFPFLSLGTPWRELGVGLALDAAGVASALILAGVFGVIFLIEPAATRSEERVGVRQAAVVLSMSSVTLAWFSDGLWGLLLAQLLAALPGWNILRAAGSGAPSARAELATAYSRERAIGWILSALGFSALAAEGVGLVWDSGGGLSASSATLGLVLLVSGALLQLRVFPALGWAASAAQVEPLTALLVATAPAWVAFATLYRLQPDLVASGLVPLLAVPALAFAALTAWFSISSRAASSKIIGLSGAASAVALSVLLLSGRAQGAAAFFCFELISWATVLAVGARDTGGGASSLVHRGVAVALTLGWLGGAGFSPGSVLSDALFGAGQPWEAAVLAIAWLLLGVAALGVLSSPQRYAEGTPPRRRVWWLSSSAALQLAASSLIWSGTFYGGFAEGGAEALGPAVALSVFGGETTHSTDAVIMVHLIWTAALLTLTAFGADRRLASAEAFRWGVAGEGFHIRTGIGRLMDRLCAIQPGVAAMGRQPWAVFMLNMPKTLLLKLARAVSASDRWTREKIELSARILVDAPGKALQLMQSGSVQHYILFAVGFTLALLVHFWSRLPG
jgi:hypothetical protein